MLIIKKFLKIVKLKSKEEKGKCENDIWNYDLLKY